MKLLFSTIGNSNYGDESMCINYIDEFCDNKYEITSYGCENVKKKYQSFTVYNCFENLMFNSKIEKIVSLINVVINPRILEKKVILKNDISKYDELVICGGGNIRSKYLWNVIHMYLLCNIFYRANKKITFRPQSIGPFEGVKGLYTKVLLKKMLKKSTEFLVREEESYNYLKKNFNSDKYKLQIDDAWSLKIEEINDASFNNIINKDNKKIAISVRPWNKKESYIRKIEDIINISLENNYQVYFIPIAYGGNKEYIDNSFVKQRFLNYKNVYFIEDLLDLEKLTPQNIKWIISHMDLCIGLSYHFNVFSNSLKKYTIGLYSDKYYFIKNMGLYKLINKTNKIMEIDNVNINNIISESLN